MVEIEFDPGKRRRNRAKHGLDFADAPCLFDGIHFDMLDDRFDYGEERWVSVGLIHEIVAVCVGHCAAARDGSSRCERRTRMKPRTISKASNRDEAPKLGKAFFLDARKMDGQTVLREAKKTLRGRPAKPVGERKQAVSIRLSQEVLEHFRGTGPGWQTRVDDALRLLISKGKQHA